MDQLRIDSPRGIARRPHYRIWAALLLVAALLAGLAYFTTRPQSSPRPRTSTAADAGAIESQYGIRVVRIGVTADGGLVDLRYQVIDPEKAVALHANEQSLPVMVTEDSQALINSTALMAHKEDLRAGQTYYMLYRNTRGAIKSGTPVSLVIGSLRLEHIVAQ